MAEAQDAPPGRALALIRPFLHDIGWFTDLLAQGCAALADDPLHLPGFRASRNGAARHLVLARTERIWLSATVIDPVPQTGSRVHFSGRHMLCRPLNRALRAEGVASAPPEWRDLVLGYDLAILAPTLTATGMVDLPPIPAP